MWNRYRDTSFCASEFYKKRLIRILIPQGIGFVFGFLAMSAVTPELIYGVMDSWLDWYPGIVISFLGLDWFGELWGKVGVTTVWITGTWFTSVIAIIYLFFPFLRELFKSHRILGTIFIAVIFCINSKYKIMSNADGWFSFTYGFMVFWAGMLFEEYKNKISVPILIADTAAVFVLWVWNPDEILGMNTLACLCFSLPLFVLLYQVRIENAFTKYIVKNSYEIYLVHQRIYFLILPFWLKAYTADNSIILTFFVLLGLTFLIAEALHRASDSAWKLSREIIRRKIHA